MPNKNITTKQFHPECTKIGVSKFFDRTYVYPKTIPNSTSYGKSRGDMWNAAKTMLEVITA